MTCRAEVAIQVHMVFLMGHLQHLLPGNAVQLQWWGCHGERHSWHGAPAAEQRGGVTGQGSWWMWESSSRHDPWQSEGPAGLAGVSPPRQAVKARGQNEQMKGTELGWGRAQGSLEGSQLGGAFGEYRVQETCRKVVGLMRRDDLKSCGPL